jgi:hypothetical protein
MISGIAHLLQSTIQVQLLRNKQATLHNPEGEEFPQTFRVVLQLEGHGHVQYTLDGVEIPAHVWQE